MGWVVVLLSEFAERRKFYTEYSLLGKFLEYVGIPTYSTSPPQHISAVARRVLAQPVCASAAERNWSVYGAIKTTARGQMGHAVADKRVYCHEALHLKGKLQTAGYKQAVEKWDSDSDSDVSSDDDDLKM